MTQFSHFHFSHIFLECMQISKKSRSDPGTRPTAVEAESRRPDAYRSRFIHLKTLLEFNHLVYRKTTIFRSRGRGPLRAQAIPQEETLEETRMDNANNPNSWPSLPSLSIEIP